MAPYPDQLIEAFHCTTEDKTPFDIRFGIYRNPKEGEISAVPVSRSASDTPFVVAQVSPNGKPESSWTLGQLQTALNGRERTVQESSDRISVTSLDSVIGLVDISLTRHKEYRVGWIRVARLDGAGLPASEAFVRALNCRMSAEGFKSALPYPSFAKAATVLTQCGKNYARVRDAGRITEICIAHENVRATDSDSAPLSLVIFEQRKQPARYKITASHRPQKKEEEPQWLSDLPADFHTWRVTVEDDKARSSEMVALIGIDAGGSTEFLELRGQTPLGQTILIKNFSDTFRLLE